MEKEPTASGLRLQFVLHALRRWWMPALPASVLMACAFGVVARFLFVPQYEATAWFRMEEKSPFLAFQSREDVRVKEFFQTEVEMIRSPLVLGPVLKQAELAQLPEFQKAEDKIAWLVKQLQVKAVGQSDLFTIRFAGQKPASAAKIVNAIADSYFKLRNKNEVEHVKCVLDLLGGEKERRSQEVLRLREGLRELAKQVTGHDPYSAKADKEKTTSSPLAELQIRLIAAQVERTVSEARVKAVECEFLAVAASDAPAVAKNTPLTEHEIAYRNAMVNKAIAEHAEVKQIAAIILTKQAKLANIEAVAVHGKENPIYERLQSEIVREQRAAESMRAEIRPRLEKEIELLLQARRIESAAAVFDKQREELSRLRADCKVREILEQTLQIEYAKGLKEVKLFSGESLELEFKRDELVRAEKVFELIAQRTLEIQTERGAPARVTLLKLAEEPVSPMVTPMRNVSLGVIAGMLFPWVLAIGWERLMKRVGDTQDIEEQSHISVLGEIAYLPTRTRAANQETPRLLECVRIFEESIDTLRTTLMLSEELRGMSVLAVTSAAKHEGKTSIASQMALSLARATGQRVLLVDGDMRSPDIHRVFDIPRSPGLAEILHEECSVAESIVTTYGENVHLLPGGKMAASPHRLLGDDKWSSVLAELKAQYRYVVIDTPPVLAASEALVLAKTADATLVCVMRDVSRTDHVRQVCERLVAAGARPVGAVLNGVPSHNYAYRYGT
ncbi:MAG: polysaccharide biosynthesis tyrosine autokinase [Planctomycetota bacterium]